MTTRCRYERALALACVALGLYGCRGCGDEALRFVPAGAPLVVATPRLSRAMVQLEQLIGGLRRAGLSDADPVAKRLLAIRKATGDLGSPERFGFDGSDGAALALLPEGDVALVIGAARPDRIAAGWRWVAHGVFGGQLHAQATQHRGTKVVCIKQTGRTESSGRAALAWTLVGRMSLAVVAFADDGPRRPPETRAVEGVIALSRLGRPSMRDSASYRRSLSSIDRGSVLNAFVDVRALWHKRWARLRAALADASPELRGRVSGRQRVVGELLRGVDGVGLALQASATGLALRIRVLGGASGPGSGARSLWHGKGKAIEMERFLDPTSLVVARASLDLEALLHAHLGRLPIGIKRSVYGQMAQVKRHHGLDVEQAITKLANRFAMGLAVRDRMGPTQAGSASETPVEVTWLLVAQTSDSAAVDEVLVRVERALVVRGLDVRVRDGGDGDSPSYSVVGQGACRLARWGLVGDALVLRMAPWGCLPERPPGDVSKSPGQDVVDAIRIPRARRSFVQDSGAVVYLDAARLVRTAGAWIRDVPAFGALAWTIAILLDDLALSIESHDGDLVSEIVVRLRPG